MNYKLFFTIFISIFSLTISHTWISWLKCEDNGMVGYIREYQSRDQISDFDIYMTYLLEGRNINDPVCGPYQRTSMYYPDYPKLVCPAGSKVTFQYNTNGHVITDQCLPGDPRGCKPNGNTADTFWSIHMNNQIYPNQLTTIADVNPEPRFNDDSTLINYITKGQKFDFNDICGNESSEPCIGEFILPTDIVTDRDYQFVWYWILDRNYIADGEAYTSCFDIHIIPSNNIPTEPTNHPCNTPSPTPTRHNCRLR